MVKLSRRLMRLADEVKTGDRVADIGTDHGLLPIFLYENKRASQVILCDINEGPLEKARQNINARGAGGITDIRLGDGLEPLKPAEADTVIIAGMGGQLMIDILSKDIEKAKTYARLVLQPRNAPEKLRRWLIFCGFSIINESLVREGKYICEVITAVPDEAKSIAAPGRNPAEGKESGGPAPEAAEGKKSGGPAPGAAGGKKSGGPAPEAAETKESGGPAPGAAEGKESGGPGAEAAEGKKSGGPGAEAAGAEADGDFAPFENEIELELEWEASPLLFEKRDPLLPEFLERKIRTEREIIRQIMDGSGDPNHQRIRMTEKRLAGFVKLRQEAGRLL